VNKYLHTVASVGILFTLNYDARNHELKTDIYLNIFINFMDAEFRMTVGCEILIVKNVILTAVH